MDLIRVVTVGSVDDGKSTLIGRLLYDSKQIFEDQLSAIESLSKKRGEEFVNLAYLTDGLKAEREQGITIDVAYRYFSTPKRKFILADCPGHIQYTRNMVTGASTANAAIVLVDARKGVIEQTKRHSFLASLLGIPHLIVCINKMDLVDYSEQVFEKLKEDFENFSARLSIHDIKFVPMSALNGDNVVEASKKMPWYSGSSLLQHLEGLHIASDRNFIDFRFPVQYVIRPQSNDYHDYRGYAGTIASGVIRTGEEIMIMPSGFSAKVAHIESGGKEITEAFAGMAVILRLDSDIDVSRGNMIVRANNQPESLQDIEALVAWLSTDSLNPRAKYSMIHTSHELRCMIKKIRYKIDVNTLGRITDDESLSLNEIARVYLRTTEPVLADSYRNNRNTGSFIIIDESTNNTVGAGMII